MEELFLRDNKKPISSSMLSQLPRHRFNVESVEGSAAAMADEKNCRVCMGDYEQGEMIMTLTCFHKFHAECIETWFKSQNWCPICRTKLDEAGS